MKTRKWKDIAREIEGIKEAIAYVKSASIAESEKNKILEYLGKEMNKLKNQGVAIITDEVFYGKAPTKFLRNSGIKLQAKGLYAVMHSYSQPKELMLSPKTFVSLKTLSEATGLKRTQIIYWIRYLEEIGWITIKRRGLNMTNWYILHSKKKYRKD